MRTPLPTTKVTDGTNDLANIPNDTSTDSKAHFTLNHSPDTAHVQHFSTSSYSSVGALVLGCFGLGFDTTPSVDVDIEPISEHVLRLRMNGSSQRPSPHVQLLDDPGFTLTENSVDSPPCKMT